MTDLDQSPFVPEIPAWLAQMYRARGINPPAPDDPVWLAAQNSAAEINPFALEEPQWLKEAPAVARPRTANEEGFLMDAPRLIEGAELVDLNLALSRMASACGDAIAAIGYKINLGCTNRKQAERLLAAQDRLDDVDGYLTAALDLLYMKYARVEIKACAFDDDCPF